MYLKQPKVRDRKYLDYLATCCCVVCGSRQGVVGHHLKDGADSGMATKSSDCFAISLCHLCHIEDLHRHGEKQFLNKYKWCFGSDPIAFAKLLYKRYLTNRT